MMHSSIRFLLSVSLLCVVMVSAPAKAYANCINPTADTGTVRYNSDYDVFQGCTSTEWVAFHDYKTTVVPKGCTNPGDVCDDGSVYAGFGYTYGAPTYEQTYFFVTFRDAPRTTFNNGSTSWTLVTGACTTGNEAGCWTGTENTKALALATDAGSPHIAARYCHNLTQHGRNDWYLPSFQEHRFGIYPNRAAIPNLKISGTSLYTSSSENSNRYYISKDYGLEDNQGWLGEKRTYHGTRVTRCMRRLGCFNPTAPTSMLAYNQAEDSFQGCTISGWVKIHEDAAGAGCTNPTASPGEYGYNSAEDVFQGCTAKGWVSFHRP
jgi:hypothetical protein